MDGQLIIQLLKLVILMPLIIIAIYITFKYGGKYMDKMSSGRIIKVIEKVPLSQNSFLSVVVIDNKPFVVSNGEKGVQILLELDPQVVEEYQAKIEERNKMVEGCLSLPLSLLRRKGEK